MSKKDTYKNLMDKTVLSQQSKNKIKNMVNDTNNDYEASMHVIRRRRFAIPTAAAALVLTVLCGSVIGTSLCSGGSESENNSNSFFIAAYAAEAGSTKNAALTEKKQIFMRESCISYCPVSYNINGEIVIEDNYRIVLDSCLKCEGENIHSVTYTGNGVNFSIYDSERVTVKDENIIKSYAGYGIDQIFSGITGGNGDIYCNEFTVDYSKYSNSEFYASIWNVPDTSDPETAQAVSEYAKLYNTRMEDKTKQMQEDKENGRNSNYGGVFKSAVSEEELTNAENKLIKRAIDNTSIGITVKFNDGSTATKRINIYYELDETETEKNGFPSYAVMTNLTD